MNVMKQYRFLKLWCKSRFLSKERRFIFDKIKNNELLFKDEKGYWFANMERNQGIQRYIDTNDLSFLETKGFIIAEELEKTTFYSFRLNY